MGILLARAFRAIGRFILTIGLIFAVGSLMLIFFPNGFQASENSSTIGQNQSQNQNTSKDDSQKTAKSTEKSINPVHQLFTSFIFIVLASLIIIGAVKVSQQHNAFMRFAIKRVADFLSLPIYATELLLTTLIWSFACVFSFSVLPAFGIFSLVFLIANLFCFIFAWIFYGLPKYQL